jgi:hypothetical protein
VCNHIETVIVTTANPEVILGAEIRERILSANVNACVSEAFAIELDNVVLRTAPDSIDYWRGERAADCTVLEVDDCSVSASKVASVDDLEERVVHDGRGECINATSLPFERLLELLIDVVVDSGGDLVDVL